MTSEGPIVTYDNACLIEKRDMATFIPHVWYTGFMGLNCWVIGKLYARLSDLGGIHRMSCMTSIYYPHSWNLPVTSGSWHKDHQCRPLLVSLLLTWFSISSNGSGDAVKRLDTQVTLIQWSRVTNICVGKLNIVGSDNGLSPGRCQATVWSNTGILLIGCR